MNVVRFAQCLGLLSSLSIGTVSATESGNPLANHVRAANDRFRDVSAAVAEGYAAIPCASGIDGGAMGVHYVNPRYLKEETINLKHPQAVMYEPMPDGRMM